MEMRSRAFLDVKYDKESWNRTTDYCLRNGFIECINPSVSAVILVHIYRVTETRPYLVSTCTPPTVRLADFGTPPVALLPILPDRVGLAEPLERPGGGASCSEARPFPLSGTGDRGFSPRAGCVNPGMSVSSRSSSSERCKTSEPAVQIQ
jgi:hypothetical protein